MQKDYTIGEREGAYITASLTIPRSEFKKTYNKILTEEAKKTDIKGFRKGKVPADIVEPQIKNSASLQALEELTPTYVSSVVEQENLQIIAPPQYVEFPNMEGDKDLELKVKFTVFPKIKIGDLKSIKVKKEDTKPTKEEIDNTISEMFKNSDVKTTSKKPTDKWAKDTAEKYKLENVKTLEDLKKSITEMLKKEKERIMKQNQEHEILTKAIELSKIEVPQEAIDFEAFEREKSFLSELKRANLSVDEFCKTRETDFESLRKAWQKDAREALQGEILLKTYAQEKKITLEEGELEKAIEEIKAGQQQEIPKEVENDERWRNNITNVVLKQKAYKKIISEVLK